MKQLVLLSGKGGTGKTSLAAAFVHLAHGEQPPTRVVMADADVDAANLELVLRSERLETHSFTAGAVAIIDQKRCNGCGLCKKVCRFYAIHHSVNNYLVDPIACEGCAACAYHCPADAIQMKPRIAGQWYRSKSLYGTLFHADLFPAQENSGKLVTLVKQNARLCAMDENTPILIVDGPPGIGCPVIASAAGADLAVIVTEPTVAGAHDLKRIFQTTVHFHIPAVVVINKADIFPEGSAQIAVICRELGGELIGQIPFDPLITEAMLNGVPITAYRSESPSSLAVVKTWRIVRNRLISWGDRHA